MKLEDLNYSIIQSLDKDEASDLYIQVLEAVASLPPVKRRAVIKDQSRDPDIRTAFEDPYAQLRIFLQMCKSDLEELVMSGTQISA